MRFDPCPTTVAAALLSSPAVSRIVTSNDRKRLRRLNCRAQLLDHVKWLRRFQALRNPLPLWTESEPSKTTPPSAFSLFPSGIHPVVTGILLSGITAFVLHVAGSFDVFKHFSPPSINVLQELARGRKATVEEGIRATLKEIEVGVDAFVENASPEDSTLTKEDVNKQQALIHEVWETVAASYYNERDPSFSKERWAKIRDEALRQKPKTKSSANRMVKQMISKGLREDAYAKLMSPEEFRLMRKYDMTGVGLNIGSSEDYYLKVASKQHKERPRDPNAIWVMGLLQGSVAEQAGIRAGEQLLEIDGVGVSGSTSYEVAQKIKGNASRAKVMLTIRSERGETRIVEMQREIDRVTPSVKTSIERARLRRVGRIAVSNCNSEARKEILNGLSFLQREGIGYVILDLRGNPGGLVDEAAEIAKLFLEKGATVYIKRMGGEANQTRIISHQIPQTNMRLAVQVDDRTASAAEIVAGAIQDNCRGVVIGRQTFGKGLIQSIFQLSDGSGLTLTVGKYYTPRMKDIDQLGIDPDFTKLPSREKADDALKVCRLRQARRAT